MRNQCLSGYLSFTEDQTEMLMLCGRDPITSRKVCVFCFINRLLPSSERFVLQFGPATFLPHPRFKSIETNRRLLHALRQNASSYWAYVSLIWRTNVLLSCRMIKADYIERKISATRVDEK